MKKITSCPSNIRHTYFHFSIFIICALLSLHCPATLAEFHWNRLEPVSVSSPGGIVNLPTPAGVPSDTGFVQLQAHLGPDQPARGSLAVSTHPGFDPLHTATGRHTGLLSLNVSIAHWYLRVNNLTTIDSVINNVTVWIVFMAKAWDEPIPGGCDLTSPVPNPPSLAVSQLLAPGIAWRLTYALAGEFNAGHHGKESCNVSLRKARLRYRLYALELRSSTLADWREGLQRMATAQEAVAYGRLLTVDGDEAQTPRTTRFDVGARPSASVMYTLVVEQTDTGQFSAYVPVTVDVCFARGSDGALDSCVLGAAIQWKVGTIAATILGLFLCIMGFRYFALSVLICAFSSGALFVLPGTIRAFTTTSSISSDGEQLVWLAYLLGAGVAGLLIGLAALAIWLRCKSTVLALLFVHLPCSYLLACLAFATPFGRLWWVMRDEYICFMTLAVLLLLCLLVLLLFSNAGAIFSLSLLGTFTVTVCVSANLLIGSMFPYIFLDLFRRTSYKDYNRVHLAFVFRQTSDWILLASWIAATLLCCLLQYCWNRRAMDPALRGAGGGGCCCCCGDNGFRRGSLDELPPVNSERTPLLTGARRVSPPPGYSRVDNSDTFYGSSIG